MKKKTIGERIVELRQKKGLTQSELALAAGLDQGNLSRIERGLRLAVSPDVVVALAEALDCSTDAILIG